MYKLSQVKDLLHLCACTDMLSYVNCNYFNGKNTLVQHHVG
jgi:hypothetical protein